MRIEINMIKKLICKDRVCVPDSDDAEKDEKAKFGDGFMMLYWRCSEMMVVMAMLLFSSYFLVGRVWVVFRGF